MASVKKSRGKGGWIIFLLSLLALLYVFSAGDRGFLQQWRIRQQQKQLKHRIEALKSEKARLEEEKKNLDDPAYIEQIAREEYGMAKENETVYKIIPESGDSAGHAE